MNYKIISLICGVLLLLAIPNLFPYGFYTLLRWVICASSIFIAIKIKENENNKIMYFFWISAILFNPIAPVYFDKSIWILIDLITAIMFFNTYLNFKKKMVS